MNHEIAYIRQDTKNTHFLTEHYCFNFWSFTFNSIHAVTRFGRVGQWWYFCYLQCWCRKRGRWRIQDLWKGTASGRKGLGVGRGIGVWGYVPPQKKKWNFTVETAHFSVFWVDDYRRLLPNILKRSIARLHNSELAIPRIFVNYFADDSEKSQVTAAYEKSYTSTTQAEKATTSMARLLCSAIWSASGGCRGM